MQEHAPGDFGWENIKATLDAVGQDFEEDNTNAGETFTTHIEMKWYQENQPGHDDVISDTAFSPRNEDQQRTNDFILPEVYYQVLGGDNLGGWTEKIIKYQGDEYMPHPGKPKWKDGPFYYKGKFKLYNESAGNDKDRGELYESPTLLDWDKVTLDGSYGITV